MGWRRQGPFVGIGALQWKSESEPALREDRTPNRYDPHHPYTRHPVLGTGPTPTSACATLPGLAPEGDRARLDLRFEPVLPRAIIMEHEFITTARGPKLIPALATRVTIIPHASHGVVSGGIPKMRCGSSLEEGSVAMQASSFTIRFDVRGVTLQPGNAG